MSVSIRLTRGGAKKKPFYRIVAMDKRARRDGAFLDKLGYYNPTVDPAEIVIDMDKLDKWMKNGAHMSDTVLSLVRKYRKMNKTQEQ